MNHVTFHGIFQIETQSLYAILTTDEQIL